MLDFELNWIAILVVVVGSMILGFLWYSKGLFGKPWMASIGKTEEDLKRGQGAAMSSMVILSIVQMIVLANVVAWVGAITFMDGLVAGLIVWVGFVFTSGVMNGMFAQRGRAAVWIEQIYYGTLLGVSGGVLAVWV